MVLESCLITVFLGMDDTCQTRKSTLGAGFCLIGALAQLMFEIGMTSIGLNHRAIQNAITWLQCVRACVCVCVYFEMLILQCKPF